MGLLPAVHDTGYAVREVRLVDDRGRMVGGLGSGDLFRRALGERFVSLPRGDLAAVVASALGGGVETLFGNDIATIDQRATKVRLVLASGAEREFDLLIGADGLHSRVRELIFGSQRQFERNLGYFVAAFEASGYRPRDELVYVGHSGHRRRADATAAA